MRDVRSPKRTALHEHKGFTLLELAVVLALLGVMLAFFLASQGVVEQYQQNKFVTHVQTLEARLKAYRTAYGRWPGDCNRDGLLDYAIGSTALLATQASLDYAAADTLSSAANSSAAYELGMTCPASTLADWPQVNVPYNELKLGGQASAGEPNRKTASHGLGGFIYLGHFTIPQTTGMTETLFNAMVLTKVSIASARRLAVAIDGHDGAASNSHRVRRLGSTTTFAPSWTASGETEAKLIDVVVFFDRIPPKP